LRTTLEQTTELDAAVILAFDSVYDRDGTLNQSATHLHVKNDYVMELAKKHPKMLFGASVNPYLQGCGRGIGTVYRGGSGAAEVVAGDAKLRSIG